MRWKDRSLVVRDSKASQVRGKIVVHYFSSQLSVGLAIPQSRRIFFYLGFWSLFPVVPEGSFLCCALLAVVAGI